MPTKFQFLLRLKKNGRAKYLSQREFLNIIEQSIRRANIPIIFSEGFNPRPRLSFTTALAVGISSDDEVIYLQFSEWLNPKDVIQKINKKLIEDIVISTVKPCIPLRQDTLDHIKSYQETDKENTINNSISNGFNVEYKITPLNDMASNELLKLSQEKIENWMNQVNQIVQRDYINKNFKEINIRNYVQKIELKNDLLFLTVKITNKGTARPNEIILSLGLSGSLKDGSFSIHKIKTFI
ncbi:MAG: TIGR03936 family radical SAM-associated protein [Planctomycetota bacterium]